VSILDRILPARRRRIREVRDALLGTARHRALRHEVLAQKIHLLFVSGRRIDLVSDYISGRLSATTAQKILDGEIK
jgi:hypothetical protein